MRIHSFQHVAFEDVGSISTDIQQQGHSLTTTHWYKGEHAPDVDAYDALIIMGGPMNVYDEAEHPWLVQEKVAIAEAIKANKKILGICLGAQLIACVQGAKVTRNAHREIGWFPITPITHHPIANLLQQSPKVFHWHGDTFALPPGATLLASSEACTHQAFIIGQQILGFQFHLETTTSSAQALIEHCGDELDGTEFVQSATEIMNSKALFLSINQTMSQVFHWLLKN